MCCCEADWKREVVPDHKFDFVNVREFHKTDIWTRIKYIFKYVFLLKSIAVYGLDIFTATTMILSDHWTNSIGQRCGNNCAIDVQFKIAKWVFVGCIIFSFLLLAYETWKAKQVIDSRDISYAFTNLMANDYYSFRAYDNFCLFCHIEGSTKKKDDFAFFIFFTFKGWKRLLLADGPRQSINALVLYSFAYANGFQTDDIPAYWDNSAVTAMLLFSMIATVLIFAGSLLLLIVAAVFYVPLLCYIQGNLKEYVCHKVDKRISELIKKKQRQRIARNAALEKKIAQGGLKNAKGEVLNAAMPQPTLPQISLEDDDSSSSSIEKARRKAERSGMDTSGLGQRGGYDYPPAATGDYGSSTNLLGNAAPLGISYPPPAQHSQSYDNRPYSPSYSSSASAPFPTSRSNPDLTQPTFPPSRSNSDFTQTYTQTQNHPSFPPSRSYSDLSSPPAQPLQSGRISPYQQAGFNRTSYGSGHSGGLPYDESYYSTSNSNVDVNVGYGAAPSQNYQNGNTSTQGQAYGRNNPYTQGNNHGW
ncbi:uncharacterized protein I303_102292 [Kwoniella dejecticola CBS 10117]|uniref:Vacuolar protein n=1 Tax=Kwoniella dejecticola CBS 10117 TaxID=1296121 RepID=A0A1A6ABD1_9TREE|nr:vacuolar protein [Kwoniella dejecticola CBS 10117]OBR87366.1 vacuolar protein [Kwoniella dejecticola CBS 10117]